jgi:hypothetical protein
VVDSHSVLDALQNQSVIWVVSLLGALWFGVHWCYVLAMGAKAAYEKGALTTYWMVMLAVPLVVGVILDFVFQFTVGWVVFVETPFRGGALFSGRVKYHFRNSDGWRLKLSKFWARNLNVFDPTHITPYKG